MNPEQTKENFQSVTYMERFQCAGGECATTCCTGWEISLEPERLVELQKALPILQKTADEVLKPVPKGRRTPQMVALLKKENDGSCTMLSSSGLCTIHQAVGSAALPRICDQFPRRFLREEEQLILVGETSCPVVAHEVLNAEDAFEFAPSALPAPPRQMTKIISGERSSIYRRILPVVRRKAVAILTEGNASLQGRLFGLWRFTSQFDSLLSKVQTEVDWEAVKVLLDTDFLSEEHADDTNDRPETPIWFLGHVGNSIQPKSQPGLCRILTQVFALFNRVEGGTEGTTPEAIGLWLRQQHHSLSEESSQNIVHALHRLVLHFWLAVPYTDYPTLSRYVLHQFSFLWAFQTLLVLQDDWESAIQVKKKVGSDPETFALVAMSRVFDRRDTLGGYLQHTLQSLKVTEQSLIKSFLREIRG